MITRVRWLPGSDRLLGDCHCGAQVEGTDPASVWDWLLAHPAHPDDLPPVPSPATLPVYRPPAHLVSRPTVIGRRAVPPG